MPSSSELYAATAEVLKQAEKPIDFDAVVVGVQAKYPQYSSFEIKDAIWALVDDHVACLNEDRELIVAAR